MKNRLSLYFFGLSLGLKSILKLRKISLRFLEMVILPMSYWRAIETPLMLNSIEPKENELILDLGSPKLLSFYIAKKKKAKVISSDINPYFLDYCKDFKQALGLSNEYRLEVIDATRTKLKNNFVDKIYALSVFEHIPGNGDSKAMREAKRILRKGGDINYTLLCKGPPKGRVKL